MCISWTQTTSTWLGLMALMMPTIARSYKPSKGCAIRAVRRLPEPGIRINKVKVTFHTAHSITCDGLWSANVHPIEPRALLLGDQEPGSLQFFSNLTIPSEPFNSREDELISIEKSFFRTHTRDCHIFNLYGPAGVGKTQIALEFARRFGGHFGPIFWIDSQTSIEVEHGFLEIARALRLPRFDVGVEGLAHEAAHSVLEWLRNSHNTNWLIIFDGVGLYASSDVRKLISKLRRVNGYIIITSRFPSKSGSDKGCRIGPMSLEDSRVLMHSYFSTSHTMGPSTHGLNSPYASLLSQPFVDSHLDNVSNVLDGLPLAQRMAAGYMMTTAISPTEFVHRYRKQSENTPEYSQVQQGSFFVLLKLIEETLTPATRQIISMCSTLSLESIPLWIFEEATASFSSKCKSNPKYSAVRSTVVNLYLQGLCASPSSTSRALV